MVEFVETTTLKVIAVAIGMASLIVQLSIVVIIAVNNNLLSKYGYETISTITKIVLSVGSLFFLILNV